MRRAEVIASVAVLRDVPVNDVLKAKVGDVLTSRQPTTGTSHADGIFDAGVSLVPQRPVFGRKLGRDCAMYRDGRVSGRAMAAVG